MMILCQFFIGDIMLNDSFTNALKEGFSIFHTKQKKMLPLGLIMLSVGFLLSVIPKDMNLFIVIGSSLFLTFIAGGVMIEWIQSMMLDHAPSIQPYHLLGRIHIIKLMITNLLLSVLIVGVVVIIAGALFVPLFMTLAQPSVILISFVIFGMYLLALMIQARFSYLSIHIALENRISFKHAWDMSKGKTGSLMGLIFLSSLPAYIFSTFYYSSVIKEMLLTMPNAENFINSLPFLQDIIAFLNYIPFSSPDGHITLIVITTVTYVLSLIPLSTVCAFFRSQ